MAYMHYLSALRALINGRLSVLNMFLSFQSRAVKESAASLYAAVVAQSRRPVFYAELDVPDTVDGRFDILCLHVFLVIDRLGGAGREGRRLAQAMFNQMFLDMERAVREMGVGDLGVAKHVRRMMKAFNGRCLAYKNGLEDPAELEEALVRNIYGTTTADGAALSALVAYVRQCRAVLGAQPDTLVTKGSIAFPREHEDEQNETAGPVAAGMVA